MKKFSHLLIALLAISLSAAVCGGSKEKPQPVNPPQKSEQGLEKEIKQLNKEINQEIQTLKEDPSIEAQFKDNWTKHIEEHIVIPLKTWHLQKLEAELKEKIEKDNQGLAEKVKEADAKGEDHIILKKDISSKNIVARRLIEIKLDLKREELFKKKIEVKKKELELDKLKK